MMKQPENKSATSDIIRREPKQITEAESHSDATGSPEFHCSTTKNRQKPLHMFCGCLVKRTENSLTDVRRVPCTELQLLPSSAIQSMESLSIARNAKVDSNVLSSSYSDEAHFDNCVVLVQPTVNLPSCALITDALLSQAKCNAIKPDNSKMTKNTRYTRLTWGNLKSLHKRIIRNGKFAKSGFLTDSKSTYSKGNSHDPHKRSEVDETLVFSPLPTQLVPEAPRFEKQRTTLLGPVSERDKSKKCFVIDLDETLVHSSFKVVENADFKVGVEIDGITHRVYVLKRPYVDLFLSTMSNLYECVLFTASLAKYADPVADFIDKWNSFRYRLFRESCVYHRGNYVKDLSHLGRPINQVVILDNSPASYMFHADHAIQISSWFDDANDRVLLDLIPYFETLATQPNVVDFLKNNAPPTPFAAVGTVGLVPNLVTHSSLSTTTGRLPDSNAVITNIQHQNAASSLSMTEDHDASKQEEDALDVHKTCTLESRSSQYLASVGTLPTITKLPPPTSGPSRIQSSPTSFLSPFSLATYLPLTSESNSITTTNQRSYTSTRILTSTEPCSMLKWNTPLKICDVPTSSASGSKCDLVAGPTTFDINQDQLDKSSAPVSRSNKLSSDATRTTSAINCFRSKTPSVIDENQNSSTDTGSAVVN